MSNLILYEKGNKNTKTLNFAPTFGWMKDKLVEESFLIEVDDVDVLMVITSKNWYRSDIADTKKVFNNAIIAWEATLEKEWKVVVGSLECHTIICKKDGISFILEEYMKKGYNEFRIKMAE